MTLRKKIVAACLAAGVLLGMASAAGASRADGVCGGIGHYNPATGQCDLP